MAYHKFGPDSVGRIVELPIVDGNIVRMPHRKPARENRRNHSAKVIQFARLRSAAPAIEGGKTLTSAALHKFKGLPGQKGPGQLR